MRRSSCQVCGPYQRLMTGKVIGFRNSPSSFVLLISHIDLPLIVGFFFLLIAIDDSCPHSLSKKFTFQETANHAVPHGWSRCSEQVTVDCSSLSGTPISLTQSSKNSMEEGIKRI